ncbi:TonB-dependent receptor [Nitrosomonas europaea]|uniref:TonB-dependent siderophore receptor n=1 Tax=Nitrosomonas europaea TaxID=915 RepID=UPI003267B566
MIIKTVSLRHGFLLGSVLATGLFVSANVAAQSAAAQQTIAIDLAAQPLEQAITQLATQAGLLIGVDASLVAGKQAPALNGRFTPLQAIGQLLKGSGLIVIENAPGRYTLEAASANGHMESNAEAMTLPEIRVSGEIEPNSPDNRSYSRPSSFSATKTDTRIMETPVSIQTVPRAVIDDQKSVMLKDILENISGVHPNPTLGYDTNFIMRGFSNNVTYRNGLIANSTFTTSFDTANLQSVEVFKGPASILFGRSEPGGLLNITTKKPLATPYYALEQQFGAYGFYRTQWDATGPVTENNTLFYRFNGSYLDSKSFRDDIFKDRIMASGSVTWRPTNMTELTIEAEGLHQEGQIDYGIPVIGNRSAPIPISRTFGDRNDPVDKRHKIHVGTEFVHRFNADWLIRNRFLMTHGDDKSTFVNPTPAFGSALRNDRFLDRNFFYQFFDTKSYTTNLDLNGKFELAQTHHEVLIGFDYLRSDNNYSISGEYNNSDPALTVDIFNPISTETNPAIIQQILLQNKNFSTFRNEWFGVYFQDHITLWDKLHILAGGRYDWASTGRGRSLNSFSESEKNIPLRKDSNFSPRVGILYQLLPQISLFGNWTTSFGANNGISATGASFKPQTGEQFEVGIKGALFQEKLIATLTFYNLTKDNLLTPDLSTPDPLDRIAVGRQRSRGIELDVSGQLTRELSLIGSYAYTDAKVVRDNSGLQGNLMPLVPDHSGSIWLRYDVKQFVPLDGLSFGVGVFAVGKREGDIQNTFKLPGYARLDAFAAYRMKLGPTRLTAQINARNILDKRYYESTDPNSNVAPRLGVYPGAPLTILGSLRLEY